MSKKRAHKKARPRQAPPKDSPGANYAAQGNRMVREEQFGRAIQMFRQAIKLEPGNATWHMQFGQILIRQERTAEGIKHLEQALELNAELVPALIELGQIYGRKLDFDKALPPAEKALALSPESPRAHVVYAVLLHKQGDLPAALEYYRSSLEKRLNKPTKAAKPNRKDGFDTPETEQLMWDTLSLLAKSGVHAFPMGGTLLGLVREGGLLPFDKDIDLGIPYSEMDRAQRCLEDHGWLLVETAKKLTNPRSFLHLAEGLTLDVGRFAVDVDTNEVFYGFWQSGTPYDWNRYLRYPSITLKKATTPDGKPIWWPQAPDAILEADFGDWQTPDPDFNSIIGGYNLCGFSLMTQCYGFAGIYEAWQQGNIKKALSLIATSLQYLPGDELLHEVKAHLQAALPDGADNNETPEAISSTSQVSMADPSRDESMAEPPIIVDDFESPLDGRRSKPANKPDLDF